MRVSLLLAPFVAVLLVLGTSVFSVQAQQGSAPRPSGSPAPQSAGTNIAVIDINQVFQHHKRFLSQREDIKKDVEAFEAFIRAERQKISSEGEKLADFDPSSRDYKQREQALARMQSELQVDMQLKRKEFLEREAKAYYNAYMEILDHVAQFADRYRIGLVLRFNGEEIDPGKQNSVLEGINRAVIFQRNLNITEHIVDQLNRGSAPAEVSRPPIPSRPSVNR